MNLLNLTPRFKRDFILGVAIGYRVFGTSIRTLSAESFGPDSASGKNWTAAVEGLIDFSI